MPEEQLRRTLRPAIWMILITALLDMMAMGIVMPVLPRLIEKLTGSLSAAGRWTGMIASLWALMQFLSASVIGGLSDRYGRRPVILVSAAGLALDWVLMALAPNLWWLVLGRIIGGVTSASATALFAYLADITTPERRARAFGLIGATASAGFVAGPALGGVLGQWGSRLPFWVAAGLSSMAFLYGLFVLPESLPPERRTAFAWRRANPIAALRLLKSHRELLGLAFGSFLLTFVQRLFMTVFVLFAAHRHDLRLIDIGALLALSSVPDLVMQGIVVGPATARFLGACMVLPWRGISARHPVESWSDIPWNLQVLTNPVQPPIGERTRGSKSNPGSSSKGVPTATIPSVATLGYCATYAFGSHWCTIRRGRR